MKRAVMVLLLLGMTAPAVAVRLSIDSAAQVLIVPWFQVGDDYQTVFEVRNRDPLQGKAVRMVVKDPINGRPTLSLNIYLKPQDSWSGALYDPEGMGTSQAVGHLAPWQDDSCTVPERTQVSGPGIALSAAALDEDLTGLKTDSRLSIGYIEFYEMGTIASTLAGDCAGLRERWASGGVWASADGVSADTDLSPASGSLEVYAAVINNELGVSFQFEALGLDDFRNVPLHTHPDNARQPNLADVQPAESRVLETVRFGNRTLLSERVSNWSEFPIQAVDAVLMTASARGDYSRNQSLAAGALVMLTMPTRPYHTDAQGYYLDAPASRVMAPFKVSTPPQVGESLEDNRVSATSINRSGVKFELRPFANAHQCNLTNGVVTQVFMTDIITFDHTCKYHRAEFRVANEAREGEVVFQFSGQMRSDQGHVYRGLPVYGVLVQTLRNEQVPLSGNRVGIASHGWARPLKSAVAVVETE